MTTVNHFVVLFVATFICVNDVFSQCQATTPPREQAASEQMAHEQAAREQTEWIGTLIAPDAEAFVLGTGYGFCEGPAADPVGNIYFSDGKKNAIHFYPYGREVQLFTDRTIDANGMMFGPLGESHVVHGPELFVCEGAAYRVSAYDTRTGERRTIAEGIDGGRFNEPNDLAIDRFGGFYFTDPNYRHGGQETVRKEDTYYCSAEGVVSRVSPVCKKPNGVLLSPDGSRLYLADNGDSRIYVYDVAGPGKLENERSWAKTIGGPDGMTCDAQGNLYVCCGPKGVEIFASDDPSRRAMLGRDRGIGYASNCVFGGPDRKVLYITAADAFLGIQMNVAGMVPVCAVPANAASVNNRLNP